MNLKPGLRLRSSVCQAEVVVVKGAGDADIRCGGQPVVELGTQALQLTPDPALSTGSLLGKRYTNPGQQYELLVIRAGTGTLSINGEVLQIKEAKPLPASD